MGEKISPKTDLIVAAFLMAISLSAATSGRIIYVDANALGANSGASWADAYKYLQDALADANSPAKPVEIRVAQGIYTPHSTSDDPNGSGDRKATFQLISGVTIKGGYAGFGKPDPNSRDIEAYQTILSGDLNGNDINVNDPYHLFLHPNRAENSYHVVTACGTDATAVINGFRITGGNADKYPDNYGGGMYISSGDATVTECTLTGNSAQNGGGGIYIGEASELIIRHCTITHNCSLWAGGGIGFDGPTLIISNCTIAANFASLLGGGIFCRTGDLIISNCTVRANRTDVEGNGGGINGGRSGVIYNCRIIDNHAGCRGGGVDYGGCVANCVISGNSALNGGGLNTCRYILNCSIVGNSAYAGAATYCCPAVANCIIWENRAQELGEVALSGLIYCCLRGAKPEQGNIEADPCFADTGCWDPNGTLADANDDFWIDGDYHLLSGSPCIDAGDNSRVPTDASDLDGDANTSEPTPVDLNGHPRFVDGDCNSTEIVDMGAYEFGYAYIGFDGDCDVDFSDFAVLTRSWLIDPGAPEWNLACDISTPADNSIDMLDLHEFVNSWLAYIEH